MKLKKAKEIFEDILLVVLGSSLFSVSINMFSAANGFVQGGLTGVSIMLSKLFPFVAVGSAIFVLNIPLLIAGYFKLGKLFIYKTAFALAVSTVLIDIGSLIIKPYTQDKFLACVFCGVISGVGIGLIMLSGATTGGTEIVATLIRLKMKSLPVGRLMFFVDMAIILASYFVYKSVESIMYAAVSVFISTKMIDFVLSGAEHNKIMIIVTTKPQEISKAIFSVANRGVTVIDAKGGFTGKNKSIVLCVARGAEITRINRVLSNTDKGSFTIIGNVGEVLGQGFA